MPTRRHLIGAVGALALGATVLATQAPAPARAGAGEADPMALVEAYMAAWNAHDATKAASFFAADGQFFDVAIGRTHTGPADIQANIIQNYLTAVPDLKWQRDGEPIVAADGSGVAFQWTFSGTNTGPWSDGTEATGNPFKILGVTFMRIRDGKIAYEGDYYDALGFYQQLGLME